MSSSHAEPVSHEPESDRVPSGASTRLLALEELDRKLRASMVRYDEALAAFEATPADNMAAIFDTTTALDQADEALRVVHREYSLAATAWMLEWRAEFDAIAADFEQLRRAWSPMFDGGRA